MKPLSNKQLELVALLDTSTMAALLDDLIEICNGKAEHVRTNWQDERLGEAWDEYADALNRAVAAIMKMELKP